MAFAELAELQDYLGRPLGDDADRGDLLLELATSVIKSYTGQQVEAGTSIETFVPARSVSLKQFPVTAIVEVDIDGTVQDATAYTFDTAGVLRWYDWAYPSPWSAQSVVTVEYEHGYEAVPGDVKLVCLSITARAMSHASAVARTMEGSGNETAEGIGTYSVTYADASSTSAVSAFSLSDEDRRLLAPYTNFVAA